MKKIICFDVDGVLIDSSDEVMVSSWNEYNAWLAELGLPAEPFTVSVNDVSPTFRKARGALGKKSHKGYYRTAINLFILAGFNPDCVDIELIKSVSEADPNLKAKTLARLKAVRERLLKEADLSTLVHCFDEVDYDWIKTKMQAGELFFITNNAFSIEGLKATALVPDQRYVRGPHGKLHDKANHINEICRTHGVAPERVIFVDDSTSSLDDVRRGTTLLIENIVQNGWCDKPQAEGFRRMDWEDVKNIYEAL